MFTSSWCLTLTTGLLFSISSHTISGQTIRPHILCSDSIVTVLAGASGVVKHVKEQKDPPCTLRLRGFASESYLSLPGLDTSLDSCRGFSSVTVNSVNYCVKGNLSKNQIIVQLTGAELSVTLPSARENNFEFCYYRNVAICKKNLTIPEGAEASQLSGVISSSYDPSFQSSLGDCRVGIELPSPNVTLRFELLSTSSIDIQVGNKMFPPSAIRGDSRLVMTGSEKSISLSATKGDDDNNPIGSFVIRITVLHCGDIPEIPHSTYSTTPTPWLLGTKVTYSCVSGWMSNQTKENSIDCQVDGNSKTARWTSHTNILCIPEPWCQTPPSQVPNSEYKVGEDNLTATYECIKGYTTSSSESERKIFCNSTDRFTKPWEWSTTTFQCLPVECNLTADYRNISNGESVVKRYYYEDRLDYECYDGYEQVTDVICTSNGTWSTTPNCSIDSSESNPLLTKQQILIIGSVGGLLGLILVVGVVVYLCVRKARDEETKAQRDLTAPSDDDVSGGQENPYHALEPPDVISNSAEFVTGAYALVPLNFAPSAQTGTQANPKNTKKSSSVQKKDRHLPTEEVYADLGPRQSALKPPVKAKQQYTSEKPVYDESPAVPAKLDPVVFEENSLYESSGPPAARGAQSQSVEMLDNDLYDRS